MIPLEDNVQWFVGGEVVASEKEKIPHMTALKVTPNMMDSQLLFTENYNLMRQTLIDNNLMKKR